MPLGDLVNHPAVESVEIKDELFIRNIWGEVFRLDPVLLPWKVWALHAVQVSVHDLSEKQEMQGSSTTPLQDTAAAVRDWAQRHFMTITV